MGSCDHTAESASRWKSRRSGSMRCISPAFGAPQRWATLADGACAGLLLHLTLRRSCRWRFVRRRRCRPCSGTHSTPAVRPNQIFRGRRAALSPLARRRGSHDRSWCRWSKRVLLTPLGLRTLAPDDPAYVGRYEGRQCVRARQCLPPGHRLALAARARSWRGLAGRVAEVTRPPIAQKRRIRFLASAAWSTCDQAGHRPCLARSPTATPRTPRAAARFRRGRWAS